MNDTPIDTPQPTEDPEARRAFWRQQYARDPEAARMRSRRSYDRHREALLEKRQQKRDAQRLLEGRPKYARRNSLLPRFQETNTSSPENEVIESISISTEVVDPRSETM